MSKGRHRLAIWAIALLEVTGLSSACNDRQGLLPPSGGQAYEVLIVGDRRNIVGQALNTDAEGLPQSETAFDISSVDSANFGAALHMARNIVMVSVAPDLYTTSRMRYEKNVYARPQMIVYIGSPSVETLQKDMPRLAPQLVKLLNRSEINAIIAQMATRRNAKAEQTVKQMFDADMYIPMDMTVAKQGDNFLWLTNNSAESMQNIVIYRCHETSDAARFTAFRDSVMKHNIKGETDAMYMSTVKGSVTSRKSKEHRGKITIYRGLWEMEGDAMGGPFVSHVADDIAAEAFVYAPGSNKRNKMRQTEAALYTLK